MTKNPANSSLQPESCDPQECLGVVIRGGGEVGGITCEPGWGEKRFPNLNPYLYGVGIPYMLTVIVTPLATKSGHNHSSSGGGYLKTTAAAAMAAAVNLPLKSEGGGGGRLSVDSPDSAAAAAKKKAASRKARLQEEEMAAVESGMNGGGGGLEGQPPKKRGKGKGKAVSKEPNPSTGPKRVFICPHCQVCVIQMYCLWKLLLFRYFILL